MMSFNSSARWSRRAMRLTLAALLLTATANQIMAQDTTAAIAAIAEISAAATVPLAVAQTNTPAPVKTTESAPAVKIDPAAKPGVVETNATATVKSPAIIATAKTNIVAAPLSLESFKLIADRNIFNQSRVRGVSTARSDTRTPRPPRTRIESIALGGTMTYEKGSFAFFGGSTQYRKTVKLGDAIGAYKLSDVGPNQVKLTGGKDEWTLKVGEELRRENEGEWKIGASSGLLANSESASSSTNSTTDASGADDAESTGSDAAPIPDAGGNEVLRRLLEARAKEVGR